MSFYNNLKTKENQNDSIWGASTARRYFSGWKRLDGPSFPYIHLKIKLKVNVIQFGKPFTWQVFG